MSALAGLWNHSSDPAAGQGCTRMLAAQAIYGPHGSACWHEGGVALGRSIFRTLPEDGFDRQPLAGGGGRFRLVADLRLDNRDELSENFGISAGEARAMADSSFLLRAWERWGEACFEHLLGDYAFALWDCAERRLFLARDPSGARPLHYHRGADFFAFASLPKGLHTLPRIPYKPDEERVAEFLALLPEAGPRSFFEGIDRVEAGQLVIVSQSGISSRLHWQPRREELRLARWEDYADGLREQLDRAVAVRLRGAGARVATHLSGGRDSAAVTATAARLLLPSGGTVTAFTSVPREGYDGPVPEGRMGDEGPLAAATAALHPNVDHVLIRPDGSSPLDTLDRSFFLYERPVLNLCNQQWVEAINAAARQRGLTVLLTGQMGNMTISYSGMERLPQLVARGRWLRLLRECRNLAASGRMRWRGALGLAFGPWIPPRLWNAAGRAAGRAPSEVARHSLLNLSRREALEIDRTARERGMDFASRPRLDAFESRLWTMRRMDQGNYLKGMLGGWGLDVRDPTADRRLAEFCLSVPLDQYLSEGRPAALMARAFADRLPARVLEGRLQGLQAADWHEGLSASRESLAREVERLAGISSAATALDLPRIRQLLERWPESGWNAPEVSAEYRFGLLRALSSGHFLRRSSATNA